MRAPTKATVPVMAPKMSELAFPPSGKRAPQDIYVAPTVPDGVLPDRSVMAMDSVYPGAMVPAAVWAQTSLMSEGLGFFGYPYLAELMQRPEYRMIVEIYAREATRKWIKLRGEDDEYVGKLNDALVKWNVQEVFRELALLDGAMGRAHLYFDLGQREEDGKPLLLDPVKVGKGRLKNLVVIEPMWTYPSQYNASDPRDPTFYKPQSWYVNGAGVHTTRMATIVGREMPDLLKPAYAFGGLSLSQMAQPYVNNWLRTRQSVSDLIHSFSVMVLKTNMLSTLSAIGGAMKGLLDRIFMFNQVRDNSGTMVIDKDTEELECVAVPLGTLDKLQAQSQEQMASISGIPLVILLGVTPSGLNASSDGEVRSFYARVKSYQEHALRTALKQTIDIIQLSEFGKIDPSIKFEFEDLWEMSDKDKAEIRKSDAEADATYVNAGVISNEETRERLSNDETGLYYGVDLSGPPPEPEPPPGSEQDVQKMGDE